MQELDELLEPLLMGPLRAMGQAEQELFAIRLARWWPEALRPLRQLYGQRPDFTSHLHHLLHIVATAYAERSVRLRRRDLVDLHGPDWFQRAEAIGYVCYADRFAGNLPGVGERIPYLKELGINYLHLMPLLRPRAGNSDGGYAVADYREVAPRLGTMADLADLAARLHDNGIRLCIDMVCNHTAKEHEWAQKALAGDEYFQDYFLMFPDRTLPDMYEQSLLEVFPDFAPGNFTYYEQMDRWVWTTFNEFQWDLNYTNPLVLAEMVDNILFLANQGVDVLRLDAVAFMWKRMGTICQNEPEAHLILQAFRALTRLAAPSLILLAEAIVPPRELIPYLGVGPATNNECELAYHNVLMVMLWSALAERNVRLLSHALGAMPAIPAGTAWLTYIRCHDDIGWAVTDEDAGAVGLSGFAHRKFLSDFYSGVFPGSFARGGIFQHNLRTGDKRINGSAASLAGLELALTREDSQAEALALDRLLLVHGVILGFGGIPVLYMGDELGLLNDYDYTSDPDLAMDSRWLHRPVMDWTLAANRHDQSQPAGKLFTRLQKLIQTRQALPLLHAQAESRIVGSDNDQVLALLRQSARGRLLLLGNFSEQWQTVSRYRLAALGFDQMLYDHVSRQRLNGGTDLGLRPYQLLWLTAAPAKD